MALWIGLALCVGGLIIKTTFPGPEVKDTPFASPDGVYVATLHSVDNGAAGSYCQVHLSMAHSTAKDTAISDGGIGLFDSVKWTSRRVLTVGYEAGSPAPDWAKTWQDVKIVYISDMTEK